MMKLEEKLQLLRKQNGYSQEQLADKIGIARQTVSKWENGQAVPELNGLILLSDLYGVTIDRLVKDDDGCNISLSGESDLNVNAIIDFLIRAKRQTYAGKGKETKSSRPASHDFCYEENNYLYYDTYLGGEKFVGEEAVWYNQSKSGDLDYKNCKQLLRNDEPVWSMNYAGRVTGEHFSGDFLKEVLYHVPKEQPFRGPEIYTKGEYRYHCKVEGGFVWFQGYEDIFYCNEKIYECYFHGGMIR